MGRLVDFVWVAPSFGKLAGSLDKTCSVQQALKVLAPVVRKLGPRANPAKLKELPTRAIAVWLFYAGVSNKRAGRGQSSWQPMLAFQAKSFPCSLHTCVPMAWDLLNCPRASCVA